MAFTTQHYIAIAKTIRKWQAADLPSHIDVGNLVFELSEMFGQDNSRFDSHSFYQACVEPSRPSFIGIVAKNNVQRGVNRD